MWFSLCLFIPQPLFLPALCIRLAPQVARPLVELTWVIQTLSLLDHAPQSMGLRDTRMHPQGMHVDGRQDESGIESLTCCPNILWWHSSESCANILTCLETLIFFWFDFLNSILDQKNIAWHWWLSTLSVNHFSRHQYCTKGTFSHRFIWRGVNFFTTPFEMSLEVPGSPQCPTLGEGDRFWRLCVSLGIELN